MSPSTLMRHHLIGESQLLGVFAVKISSKMPNCAEQGNGTKCVMTKDTK